MAGHDEVEFLDDDGQPRRPGDELPPLPRRRRANLLIPLGFLVIVVVAVVVRGVTGDSTPAPGPSATRVHGSPSTAPPRPTATPTRYVAPSQIQAADAVTVVGGRVVAVHDGYLVSTDVTQASPVLQTHLPSLGLVAQSSIQLVPAGPNRIWLVVCGSRPATMIEYDTGTLHQVREMNWGFAVSDAAVLDGRLYLSTALGVGVVRAREPQPQIVPGLADAGGPIAVDAMRHRLIALGFRDGFVKVWTYRPGARPVARESGISLDLRGLAVTRSGAIWIGGFTHDGGQLVRLDPRTLRPIRRVWPESRFGPGAIVLSGGDWVVWVRAGDGSDRLACVDGASGRVMQTWNDESGQVASVRGRAVVAGGSGVQRLHLRGCAG